MGAGASTADLPERLDEATCKDLMGENFDEAAFAQLEKDDAGTVGRDAALAMAGVDVSAVAPAGVGAEGAGVEGAASEEEEEEEADAPPPEPEPEPEPEKTAEELSDEEFEEEVR